MFITRRGAMRALSACFLLPTRGTVPVATEIRSVVSLFSNLRSARAIGAAYLRSYPADRLDTSIFPIGLSPTERRSTIAAQVRDDFASSRVVSVDGWMLARTEAQLCALAYLTA